MSEGVSEEVMRDWSLLGFGSAACIVARFAYHCEPGEQAHSPRADVMI